MMKGFAAIAMAAVLAAAPALAEPGGGHGDRLLNRVDRNGDGAIDREEAQAFRAALFLRLDRDADGAVTEAEMIEAAQERMARRASKMFARMDGNGDGRLDRDELAARGEARFDRTDANGDGRVTMEEIRARLQARWYDDDGEAHSVD